MSHLRRGSVAPSRPWVQRTSLITETLRTMEREAAIAFLARVLYHASDKLIAEKLHVSLDEANDLVSRGHSKLRHPSRAQRLRDFVDDAEEGALVIDNGMRALIRSWHLEEMFATLCVQCERPVEVAWSLPGRAGRPRRYCSNACRQKAYRARQRQEPTP
ncbi:hypothetical protein [Streptomyces termitum]|uniref:hypothetical protein n=1 Tax=Streptomyces termitum TaxID=67368 RepID=UPI0033B6E1D2